MWAWGALILTFLGIGFLIPRDVPANVSPLNAYVIIEDGMGHGSGVFISPTQVLTAKHVTEHYGDESMRIRGPEGDIYNIIGMRKGPADIAIFEVDRPVRGAYLPVSCRPLERGERLFYYGSPMDLEFIGPVELFVIGSYKNILSILEEEPEMIDSTILVEGEAEPGASGSGVFDSEGKVVGVFNFAWNSTTFGGFVSLSYPTVCEWLMKELRHDAVVEGISDQLEDQAAS